jgi:hypothetical protein
MTHRKTRLVKWASGAAALIIIGAVLQASPSQAAEKEQKGRFVNHKSEITFVKVGDKEGHVVGTFHNTGVDFSNGEVATRFNSGTIDYVNWSGPARGQLLIVYDDGSTMHIDWQGEATIDEKKRRNLEGPYTCFGGSGRFEGIKCKGTWNCSNLDNGSCVGEYTGTMTLTE